MPRTRRTKIVNGVQLWPCNKCGEWLPKESFYTDKRLEGKKWGIRATCKKCHLKWHQEIYTQRPEVQEKERARSLLRGKTLEAKCRGILNEAIRSGKLVKPKFCPVCGKPDTEKRIEAHHDNYFRPLEVEWKCSQCHANYTKQQKEKERIKESKCQS
jgi:ribosomal protein L37AE/L43A